MNTLGFNDSVIVTTALLTTFFLSIFLFDFVFWFMVSLQFVFERWTTNCHFLFTVLDSLLLVLLVIFGNRFVKNPVLFRTFLPYLSPSFLVVLLFLSGCIAILFYEVR